MSHRPRAKGTPPTVSQIHDIIVEIDESKLAKRKHNHGHQINGCWVVGGIERTAERKMFIVPVIDRSADILKELIHSHILPGTTIITDCWKGYDWLDEDENYVHLKVNHSHHFKDPTTGAHTNSIEGSWAALKSKIPKRNHTENGINTHLLGFIWMKQNQHRLWDAIINALSDTHYN